MKKFNIPVTWEVYGVVKVEADTLEDAIKYFYEHNEDIELPDKQEYVEDSFRLSDDDIEFIKILNYEVENEKV